MTEQEKALLLLEADRPRLEVLARFLLELQRRKLRPSQVEFRRWWRRKNREVVITAREVGLLLRVDYQDAISDMLNQRFPLRELFR